MSEKQTKKTVRQNKKDISYSDTMGIKLRKEELEKEVELMPKEKREMVVQQDIEKAEQLVAKKSLKNFVPKLPLKIKLLVSGIFVALIITAIVLLVIYL